MTTKLTLSVDKQIARDVKRFAKEQGTSVSALFTRFARAITQKKRPRRPLGPVTRKALGFLKNPGDKSDRELLEEALMEKYGLK